MRNASPLLRMLVGIAAGVVTSVVLVIIVGATVLAPGRNTDRLVPEDASGHLHRIAIHYVPSMDRRALPVWNQLFKTLPADVTVEVAVEHAADFERFVEKMRKAGVGSIERFHAVVVDHPLTTWSRDRMASLASSNGGGVLSPPRTTTATGARAGDWEAPFAIARDVYRAKPRVAEVVFEGGDLAASRRYVFADANLIGRNLGRGDATRAHLEAALRRTFDQEIVWLGEGPGDVPEHHIMMYMVPLDDHDVLVGDVRMGQKLVSADDNVELDADVDGHARRFDHVAELLAARGFRVHRIPVVVLPGAGSYVTYTNALFDRDAGGKPVVYLPTYELPALDAAATKIYADLGYRVVPIDVSTIYTLNGSLGCLVNVMARDSAR
jgi:N-dimethylarginine dimethylaminohydrolase